MSSDMDIVLLLDKDKLPEDIRNKLPVDIIAQLKLSQEKLIEILKERDTSPIEPPGVPGEPPNSGQQMFAIQTGTVVGNIYKDGIYKREEDLKKR